MNPEWLRYYIAAKLNGRVEDIDFNPEDFVARVNADLVGKYVNIASRAAVSSPSGSAASCASRRRRAACCSTRGARDRASRRAATKRANSARRCARSWRSPTASTNDFDAAQPWELAKPGSDAELQDVCSSALHRGFRVLTIYCSRCCRRWPRRSRCS